MRWPEGGVDDAAVREIRRIKARVEAERLPRGADPTTHVKLGRGGLADVEWTVQLLQLRHAAAVPMLRTTRTLAALETAAAAGLLPRTMRVFSLTPGERRHVSAMQCCSFAVVPATASRLTFASGRAWRDCWVTRRGNRAWWWRTTVG